VAGGHLSLLDFEPFYGEVQSAAHQTFEG